MNSKDDINGIVTSVFHDTIKVDTTHVSLRDIKPKPIIHVGDKVKVTFIAGNRYYAKSIDIIGVEMKAHKSVEDYLTLIKEVEPFFGQELVDKLSESDRNILMNTMQISIQDAIRLYNITATYEDTKKDLDEIAGKVLELSAAMLIVIDANTNQILKRNLPKK